MVLSIIKLNLIIEEKYHSPEMTMVDAMANYMVKRFQLDDVVGERLEFHYKYWAQCSTQTKKISNLFLSAL